MKGLGAGNSDTLWNKSEYRASRSTTSRVMGWLGFGLWYFPLAPFSILFLIDEWRRGTSGGGGLFTTGTGVGGALCCDCELNRCGGNGGASTASMLLLRSMLLMLLEDPELGKRRGSLAERFKALVDFAWLFVRFVPGWRLGTGGGGGLFVGLCALGFWTCACEFRASWIFWWLLAFIRIVPKWLSELKGPDGVKATGGDLKYCFNRKSVIEAGSDKPHYTSGISWIDV